MPKAPKLGREAKYCKRGFYLLGHKFFLPYSMVEWQSRVLGKAVRTEHRWCHKTTRLYFPSLLTECVRLVIILKLLRCKDARGCITSVQFSMQQAFGCYEQPAALARLAQRDFLLLQDC